MSDGLQPAWLLHRRPYGDSGLLVELLTLEEGRVSAAVRGIRRKAVGGSSGGLLQPFVPLLVGLVGRGDLKTLRRVESVGAAIQLQGRQVFLGFYLNELLARLLPRFDASPRLFSHYGDLLPRLGDEGAELALRRFECLLLEELGYHMTFAEDAEGRSIEAHTTYRFSPVTGFHRVYMEDGVEINFSLNAVSGARVQEIHSWWITHTNLSDESRRLVKQLTRTALDVHLGDKPLRSRELARSFAGRPQPSEPG